MSEQPLSSLPRERAEGEPGDGLPQRFGKYTLLRKIATGGMAEIFLALQRSVAGFEKLVVIKRILPLMNSDKAFIEMLLHEARIAATLSHPNIVQTFDVGMIDETYYIAMEHIHGEDIRAIVRQMKAKGVPGLPLEHALAIIIGQCSGLAYAHEKRDLHGQPLDIVHRDISPQNVVVTFSGDVKIVDFGIAKSGVKMGEETKSGQLKGKVPYMAPEQAAGEEIDWRSDIFATGVMLFELTTGRRLFKGPSEYETLKLICEKEYPKPSEVRGGYPQRLERIVMKALAKSREQRYQSAREMQADLEAFARDERIPVSQIALAEWMERLFAEKIAQQKEALQDIKQLADVIAAEQPSPLAEGLREIESNPSFMPTAPASAVTLTSTESPSHRKANGSGLYLGLGIITVLAGGAIAYALKPSENTRPERELARAAQPAALSADQGNRGRLRIGSEPPGAAVWINGDLRPETTPATIERLPIGAKLQVKLTKEGYEAFKQDITIAEAGPGARVDAMLQPSGVTLQVKVANAQRASYWLDGKPVQGPLIEGVSPGEDHKLDVSAEGFATKSTTFRAQPGETKVIELTLDKAR